jgi:hypothetical protein
VNPEFRKFQFLDSAVTRASGVIGVMDPGFPFLRISILLYLCWFGIGGARLVWTLGVLSPSIGHPKHFLTPTTLSSIASH